MVAAQSQHFVLQKLPAGLLEENKHQMEEEHLCTEKLLAQDTFQLHPELGWPVTGAPEPQIHDEPGQVLSLWGPSQPSGFTTTL